MLRLALGRARQRVVMNSVATDDETVHSNNNDGRNDDQSATCGKEFVLIGGDGESGCGKSRVERGGGMFVQERYDLYFCDEPYFGISQACCEICGHILQLKESGHEGDAKNFAKICNALKEEIGDKVHLLTNSITPSIEIVGEGRSLSSKDDPNLKQAREQFSLVLRKFF